tara:strand:+ start:263 stop:619 length:357 start_codon:yes stop_codon:yes gene_type:complete
MRWKETVSIVTAVLVMSGCSVSDDRQDYRACQTLYDFSKEMFPFPHLKEDYPEFAAMADRFSSAIESFDTPTALKVQKLIGDFKQLVNFEINKVGTEPTSLVSIDSLFEDCNLILGLD